MEPRVCDAISLGSGSHLHWHKSFSNATSLPIIVIARGAPSLMMTPFVPQTGQRTEAPR